MPAASVRGVKTSERKSRRISAAEKARTHGKSHADNHAHGPTLRDIAMIETSTPTHARSQAGYTQGAQLALLGVVVNIALAAEDLPVPTATSLMLEGAQTTLDAVLAAYLTEFSRITKVFTSAAGNVRSSGLLDQVTEMCNTIGKSVRVELPSGESPVGTAKGLTENGSLVVEMSNCAEPLVVSAGDVTHLRII